jgi:glucose/mannose transport system substrate-binding protein
VRQLRTVVPLPLILALVVMACGGTTPTPSASAQATVQSGGGSCQYDKSRKPIAVASWWTSGPEAIGLTKLLDTFNAANLTTCAYNVTAPGASAATAEAEVKAAILGGRPPDAVQVPIGPNFLDTYVDEPGGPLMTALDGIVDSAAFPAGLIEIARGSDGKIYSVPLNVQRTNVLWFNKSVMDSNGITPPATWEEFESAAAKLTAAGVVPLAVGDRDGWASGLLFETILISELGPERFRGLWTAATPWDGAAVRSALGVYERVLTHQNTDHGSLGWDGANQLVIDAKAAMTVMGDWVNADYLAKNFSGYGWAPAPGNAGVFQAQADSFALPKKAPQRDPATKLLAFLASAQGQDVFNPYKGSIPARLETGRPPADGLQYNEYQKAAMNEWSASTTAIVPSMERGSAAGPAWTSAINAALSAFASDGDAKAALSALAKAALKFAASR